MMKKLTFMLLFGALCAFPQMAPKWKPATQPVWDPCSVFNASQKQDIASILKDAPVKFYVVVIKNFDEGCIGKDWANAMKAAPVAERTAEFVLDKILTEYHLAEKSDSPKMSAVLMVTAIRGNPVKRMAMSVSKPIHDKVHEPNFGRAYMDFAKTISTQGDIGPAHGDKVADGLKACLPQIFEMLR